MIDYQNAAETLKRLANQQAGFVEAIAAIQEVGGLVSAIDQYKANIASLASQQKQAEADLTAGRLAADAALAEAPSIAAANAADAAAVLDAAKTKSAELVASAQAEAERISSECAQDLDGYTAAKEKSQIDFAQSIAVLRSQVETLTALKSETQASLDDLTQKTFAIKASLSKMIG